MTSITRLIGKNERTFDTHPDALDLRDRMYQPKLVNLPHVFPSQAHIEKYFQEYSTLVLDQGNEGACTGYGLAATINYLRFKETISMSGEKLKIPSSVSPAMLYNLARLYDEWPGEDYSGSSCRGAIKGWYKHGVCLATTWSYPTKKKPNPKPKWTNESPQIPLGSYYRIEVSDIPALQSAIYEVGAIYVSVSTHNGWGEIAYNLSSLPAINYKQEKSGGHAFCIVGYNNDGFIIQNSWGKSWGFNGFALLTYADWQENANDAWVVSLGVPMNIAASSVKLSSGNNLRNVSQVGATSNHLNKHGQSQAKIWSLDEAVKYSLILGNNGVIERTMVESDRGQDHVALIMKQMNDLFDKNLVEQVVIYAHGGINSQDEAMLRVCRLGPYFVANKIFPIFIVWKTGIIECTKFINEDELMKQKENLENRSNFSISSQISKIKHIIAEKFDRGVERISGEIASNLWNKMKQNAAAACIDNCGGALLASTIAKNLKDGSKLHFIGHSAGSIWLGHFLNILKYEKIGICKLFAPACTVEFANTYYQKCISKQKIEAKNFKVIIMDNQAEEEDYIGKYNINFYNKSLLYFVSRACETVHKAPILGMEATWDEKYDSENIFVDKNNELKKWRDFVSKTKIPLPKLLGTNYMVKTNVSEQSHASHGGFDNDIKLISETMLDILGSTTLQFTVNDLSGY